MGNRVGLIERYGRRERRPLTAALAIIAAFLVVACSSRSGSNAPADKNAPVVDPAPSPTTAPRAPIALTPCPDDAALQARLETLWKPAPAKLEIISCTPGSFGKGRWLVAAYLDTYEEGDEPDMPGSSELRRVVLSADAVVAEAEPESMAPWYRAEGGGAGIVRLVDFDGDGTDEIFEEHETSHGGSSSSSVVVRRVDPPTIRQVFSREVGSDNLATDSPEPIDWTSLVETSPLPAGAGQQLVVTTSWTQGTPSADDLPPGKHVFRMKDGKLAKVAE